LTNTGSRLARPFTSRRWAAALAFALLVVVASARPASAHPYFLSSQPAPDSVLRTPPTEIDITYTETLDFPYCKVVLTGPDGRTIATHQIHSAGPSILAVVPDRPLDATGAPLGTYIVGWTAVGSDGHTVIGSFAISVGHVSSHPQVTAGTGLTGGSAPGDGIGTETLRVVLAISTVVFAGLALLAFALADAVAAEDDPARRSSAGRRAARLRAGAWLVLAVTVAALARQAVANGGWHAFASSSIGERLLLQGVLVLAAIPVLADGGALRGARRPSWPGAVWGFVVAVGLLVLLAASGHAESQPTSRRDLVLGVYSVHMVAVAVWAGALLAVVLPSGADGVSAVAARMERLRPLVTAAIVAVLVTGVADTAWGLRSVAQVVDTTYGRIISLKVILLAVMVVLGLAASRAYRSQRRTLMLAEAGVGLVVLILAGTLGQLPQPIDLPFPSQVYAASAGLPVTVGATGDQLVVGAVAPGVVGLNRIVAEVGVSDANDFLQPAPGVAGVTVQLTCGCSADKEPVTLKPIAGGPWWAGETDLPVATTWSLNAVITYAASGARVVGDPPTPGSVPNVGVADLTARIEPASFPHQVVVGVPGDLSGADGEQCQDEELGLQIALDDVNGEAADHGDLVRVVSVDLHSGVGPAMAQLRALRPTVVALPCGSPAEVAAATAEARSWGVPVIEGEPSDVIGPGVWSIGPDWVAEGRMIAEQAQRQGATSVSVQAGTSAIDEEELSGLRAELAHLGIPAQVSGLPTDAAAYTATLDAQAGEGGLGAMVVLASPAEAGPLTAAMSQASLDTSWQPARGLLASAQLMDTDYINAAGQITRVGSIEFASDIDPFDPIDLYYAQRLRQLIPGIRPDFNGVHGYDAGLVISKALAYGGGRPSASRLARIFATRFHNFVVGSYAGSWSADGGNADQISFFRSTYLNPMAMPSFAPGGASSLAHEGTFLDTGGFEQVAPFRGDS
jgi:copper transport protein